MESEKMVIVDDGYDTVYQRGERPERCKSPTLDDIFRRYAPKEVKEMWFKKTSDQLPSFLDVTKNGKPRKLVMIPDGKAQLTVYIEYPDGQKVRAKIQPKGAGCHDLFFVAEKNGFEVVAPR